MKNFAIITLVIIGFGIIQGLKGQPSTFVDEKSDLVLVLVPGTANEKDQAPILNIIEVERTDQTEVAQRIEIPIRIGAFNVAVGAFGSAEDISDELAQYDLDILGLNECPQLIDYSSNLPEWIEIIAGILDMPYYEIGTISSGDHWDYNWGTDISGNYHGKLRAILSKGPITNMEDIVLTGSGWTGASVFRGETEIKGVKLAFYSLHVPGANDNVSGSTHEDIADRVIPNETMENYVMTGDYNDKKNDGTMNYLEEKGMRFTWDDIDSQPNVGIDHILYNVSSRAHATKGGRFDPDLSDHPYVWSEIVYTIPERAKGDMP
jgi:hypothetical protein